MAGAWPTALCACFLATGAASTLCNQWLYYKGGGGGGLAMLTVLATYVGQVLVALQPGTAPPRGGAELFAVAAVDFAGAWAGALGLFLAGSAIYQVLYSSIVVFTALLASAVLHHPLAPAQWAAVLLVALGLSLSAASSAALPHAGRLAAGVALTLASTVLFAAVYVWHERLLHGGPGRPPVAERELCAATGLYGSFFCAAYLVALTVPRWEALVAGPVRAAGGSWGAIAGQLGLLVAFSLLHNVAYFGLIDRVGGTATGVLQGLRAVLVFFGSALFFCDGDEGQCFTAGKAAASCCVVVGVLCFSLAASRPRPSAPKPVPV
mmetsp:Transcript_12251/g.49187  ORF Transcript_12251/g.49187 Transcript_12251/m.49187 type:complete len:322 (-) Transcript_12251:36-1001(-)